MICFCAMPPRSVPCTLLLPEMDESPCESPLFLSASAVITLVSLGCPYLLNLGCANDCRGHVGPMFF